jgi:hypothetical protein
MLDAEVSSVRMLWVGLRGSLDASSWDLLHGCAKEVAAEGGVVIAPCAAPSALVAPRSRPPSRSRDRSPPEWVWWPREREGWS